MNIAELFVQIGVKIENLDQLAALETMLRNVTAQAKAAVAAIQQLNGLTTGAGGQAVNPLNPPTGPATPAVNPLVPTAPVSPTAPNPTPIPSPVRVVSFTTAIKKLSTELNKLAVVVTVVGAGLVVMISRAITATQQMSNFGEATGLSTDRLQKFMHAAQVGGAEGKEMVALLDTLQSKQAAIALGEGDLSPFAFFGIDPNQDTNKVIDELRVKLRTFSREQLVVAREMAGRLGVGRDLFAALRRESQGLSDAFVMTPEAIESTRELSAAWADLSFKLAVLRNQLVSALAPTLAGATKLFTMLLKPVAVFLKFLTSTTNAAKAARIALGALAIILGIVAVVIVGVAAAVSALALALGLASAAGTVLGAVLWGSGIAEILLIIAGAVALLLAVLASLVVVIDEVYTALTGGDSVLSRWGEKIGEFIGPINSVTDAFSAMARSIVWVGEALNPVTALMKQFKIPDALKGFFGGSEGVNVNPLQSITNAAATPPSNQRGGSSVNSQSNDVTINVDGSRDPLQTAGKVSDVLKQSYANAAYQMPVANY